MSKLMSFTTDTKTLYALHKLKMLYGNNKSLAIREAVQKAYELRKDEIAKAEEFTVANSFS
jgi:hypothetical protein